MSYELVPDSAPFSSEQRAWLNGFFAGILRTLDATSVQVANGSLSAAAASLLHGLETTVAPTVGNERAGSNAATDTASVEDFPWHDASLSISQRMELAKERSHPDQLMAAMAQLNCGSCGYVCKTYAQAIASGTEKNLTLCSPGGTETVKMIRSLIKERSGKTNSSSPPPAQTASQGNALTASAPACGETKGKSHTAEGRLIESRPLNGHGSQKDTRHVAIDIESTGLTYSVGDALGILPTNCDQFVLQVCNAARLAAQAKVIVDGLAVTLATALTGRCLRRITSELCELLADDPDLFQDSDEFLEWDVLEFLEHVTGRTSEVQITAQKLVDSLPALKPRLYSIASSQAVYPGQVHLTVGRVVDEIRGRQRKGVASTMLADRLAPGRQLRVFIQPHHGFTIPSDGSKDMIMVGPGTGIAPFMAFLQQREHDRAGGRNWLFFGDQRRATDFLYEDCLTTWHRSGLLNRLDLAFSRDGASKVYVQHRMREHAAELFRWLEGGSHFYVCGDAKRMAKDVEQTLVSIIGEHGQRSPSDARDYLQRMKQTRRYVCDVY